MTNLIKCPECGEIVAERHKDGIKQLRSRMGMKVLDPFCPRAVIFFCKCGCEFDDSGMIIKNPTRA